ncbi:MAG: ComF family protein [Gammaproteobacteria bacterium]
MVMKRRCVLCLGRCCGELDLCEACARDLPRLRTTCSRCGLPMPVAGLCGPCIKNPPPYHLCRAPFLYTYPLDRLILGLKFDQQLRLARLLGVLFALEVEAGIEEAPECLIPIPLHPQRLILRGYNQALEIARPISQRLGIPIALDRCARHRNTAPQTRLNPGLPRRRNLRNAFLVTDRAPLRRVALLDDVVTSGATVTELSNALLRAGYGCIEVWAISRAV